MRVVAALTLLLAPALAAAGTVQLTASDGVKIKATTYGSGTKGVVLVHDDGRSAADWTTFATKLATNGFHVVALDLRGHGATGGALTDPDYPLMVKDVNAAATWLTGKGVEEVLVVGAGLGGNLALNAAATHTGIVGIAMLTPSLNAKGVKVSSAIGSIGNRALLLVADDTDALSTKAATLLADKTTGPKQLELYGGAGSGARMLNGAPALEGVLLGWLNGSWRAPDGSVPSRELNAGEVSDVETSGTQLEDRGKR